MGIKCGWHRGLKISSSRIRFKTFPRRFLFSVHCRECYQLFDAVGLYRGVVRRAVSVYFAAFGAFIYDNISLSRIGNGGHGLHWSLALVCPVARIYINVYRPETKRTVIARAFAERQDLLAAVLTNKSAVIFGKSFYFHSENPYKNPFYRAIIT